MQHAFEMTETCFCQGQLFFQMLLPLVSLVVLQAVHQLGVLRCDVWRGVTRFGCVKESFLFVGGEVMVDR